MWLTEVNILQMVPARQGHRGDTGGGQPTPPMVPYVLHDGDVEVA